MNLQLSATVVSFLFCALLITPFVACWWTAYLISKRMDGKLLDSMREAYKDAAKQSETAANTCAEAARAMIQGMKATSIVLEQTSEFATANSTKDTLDKVLSAQQAATANTAPDNGRWHKPLTAALPTVTKTAPIDDERPPDHVKLPGDM